MESNSNFLPRLIAWEITRSCPLACRHCRAAATAGPYPGELSTEECRRVIDSIAAFCRPTLILTGGEPMLRPDLYEIAAYAAQQKMRVVMATCGTLLNEAAAGQLVAAGVTALSFSLDGSTAAAHDAFRGSRGAFEKVLAAVAAAKTVTLPFQINTTITRENLDDLPAVLELAVKLGAITFNPFLLVPTGRGRDMADWQLSPQEYERTLTWFAGLQRDDINIRITCAPHYQRIIRQRNVGLKNEAGATAVSSPAVRQTSQRAKGMEGIHSEPSPAPAVPHSIRNPQSAIRNSSGCLGGKEFAFISHTGKVQLCGFLDLEAGDLRQTDFNFRPIWNDSPLFGQIRDFGTYRGRCGRCEFQRVCGGCRARAYAVSGDHMAEEPFCTYQPHSPGATAVPGRALCSANEQGVSKASAEPSIAPAVAVPIRNPQSAIRNLLPLLQSGLPLVARPFEELGQQLGIPEQQVLDEVEKLKQSGVIRVFCAVFDPRALGYVTTLVAARVADGKIDAVAAIINKLEGVTHNYRRDHSYNLWFTLISESPALQQATLEDLARQTGIAFHSLPAEAIHKLRVQFGRVCSSAAHQPDFQDGVQQSCTPYDLSDAQKSLIRLLQDDLPLTARPFDVLAQKLGWPAERLLNQLADWQKQGLLRRIAALVHHRRLGFTANGMAVFNIDDAHTDEAGKMLASFAEVSHCYRRPRMEGFPYNLYAMVHGRSEAEVRAVVAAAVKKLPPQTSHQILFSTHQYKKSSMKFFEA